MKRTMAFLGCILVLIVSRDFALADDALGSAVNHPDRQLGNTQAPEQNYVRSISAATGLPPYDNVSDPGGLMSMGTEVALPKNQLTRIELWQMLQSKWFCSQFMVVNDEGLTAAQLNFWSGDAANPSRNLAGFPIHLVLHWNDNVVGRRGSLTRGGAGDGEVAAIPYPMSVKFISDPQDGTGEISIDRNAAANGVYTGNGFNIPVAIVSPVKNFTLDRPTSSAMTARTDSTYQFMLADNLVAQGVSYTMPVETVVPTGIPANFSGDPLSFPDITFTMKNLYPQVRIYAVLTGPAGNAVVYDSFLSMGSEGGAASLDPIDSAPVVKLGKYLTAPGNYSLRLFMRTPITPNTGVAVISAPAVDLAGPASATITTVPGNWKEIVLPASTFNVSLKIKAKTSVQIQE